MIDRLGDDVADLLRQESATFRARAARGTEHIAQFLHEGKDDSADEIEPLVQNLRRQARGLGNVAQTIGPRLKAVITRELDKALTQDGLILSPEIRAAIFGNQTENATAPRTQEADEQTYQAMREAFGQPELWGLSPREALAPIEMLGLDPATRTALTDYRHPQRLINIGRLVSAPLFSKDSLMVGVGPKRKREPLEKMVEFGVLPLALRGDRPTGLPINDKDNDFWAEQQMIEWAEQIRDNLGHPENIDLAGIDPRVSLDELMKSGKWYGISDIYAVGDFLSKAHFYHSGDGSTILRVNRALAERGVRVKGAEDSAEPETLPTIYYAFKGTPRYKSKRLARLAHPT